MRADHKTPIVKQLIKAGAIKTAEDDKNNCPQIEMWQVFEPATNFVERLDNGKFLLIAQIAISNHERERYTVDACDLITSWEECARLQPDPIQNKGGFYGAPRLVFDRSEVINHSISPGGHLVGFDHITSGLLLADLENCPIFDRRYPISANLRIIFTNGTKADLTLGLGNANVPVPTRPVASRKKVRTSIFDPIIQPEYGEADRRVDERSSAKQKLQDRTIESL